MQLSADEIQNALFYLAAANCYIWKLKISSFFSIRQVSISFKNFQLIFHAICEWILGEGPHFPGEN